MIYITTTDLQPYIIDETLEDIIEADTTILDTAERAAVSIATDYLAGRYDTSLIFTESPTPHPSITRCICAITIYDLYRRVMPEAIPDHVITAYKEALQWFKDVNAGLLNPQGLPTDAQDKDQVLYGSNPKRENQY